MEKSPIFLKIQKQTQKENLFMIEYDRNPAFKKRTFAADACSLIYLQRVGLLDQLAGYRLLVTARVWQEMTLKSNEFMQTDSMIILGDFDHLAADSGVIAIFRQGLADAVLSDDVRILRFCRSNSIPHYSCLSLLSLLLRDRLLSPESARDYFVRLKTVGRYSTKIITMAELMLIKAQNEG